MGVSLLAGLTSVAGGMIQAGKFAIGLGKALGFFALGAGLSLVSRALAPKISDKTLGGQTVTTREPAATRKVIYGRTRVGGNIVFLDTVGDDNEFLYLVIAVAGHEIDGYEKVYFDDELIYDSASYQGTWDQYVDIGFFTGNQTTADNSRTNNLVRASTKWTNDHKLVDTAYLVVRLQYDPEKFTRGLPNISAVIRGKKVYAPQKDSTSASYDSSLGVSTHRINDSSTWQFSQNPALCIRDYLTDVKYGLGETPTNIDVTSLNTAQNICNQTVSLTAGGTQARYTLDGVVDTANTLADNIESMLGSMVGRLIFSSGKFELHAGSYVAPTVTIDESMVIGDITVRTKQSRRSQYNGVKGVFSSEEDNYVLADYPAVTDASFATQDGDTINLDLTLP